MKTYAEHVPGHTRTSSRYFSSSLSATRAAVKMVPRRRESGSTKAKIRLLVLGGPALTTNLLLLLLMVPLPLKWWWPLKAEERARGEERTGKKLVA